MRRFPPPWTVEKIPGGLKVCDANGQSLAYVYSHENPNGEGAGRGRVTPHSEQHRQAGKPTRQSGMRGGFGRSFALFAQLVQGTLERSRAFLDALDDETEPEKRTG